MRLLILFFVAALVSVMVGGVGYYFSQPKTVMPLDPEMKTSFAAAAGEMDGFSLLSNMPALPAVQMRDEAGNPISFEDPIFKGKVVVFNLWATWCPPCIREMPDLNKLQLEFADQGLLVVPVASGKQGKEEPAEFLRSRELNALTTYYDPESKFLRLFDMDTLPTTFVLDRQGNMRGGIIGMADWYSDEARTLIQALLNESS